MPPNKSLIGKESAPATVEVTAENVAAFAKAIGDLNPAYLGANGAPPEIAPPTYPIRMGAETGDSSLFMELDLNFASLLHGEQEFEWFRPVRIGEKITINGRVGDIWEKKGRSGTLDFAVLEQIGRDENGEMVFIGRSTLVSKRA